MHLLFAGIACKIYFLMPSNFDEKMPLDYDKFCPLKMMAFMIIKGNIICWHFLKALPSADNFHCILRAITVYFWDEVFSLRIWGHFIQQCAYLTGIYRRSIFKIRPNILIGLQKLRLRPKDRSRSRLSIYLIF